MAGATQYQAIFLSHQSAAAVTAARQGVSDLNFDGWKTCSSDAVLLESKLKSELQEEELKITLSPKEFACQAATVFQNFSSIAKLAVPDDQVS